jgi:pimeloyl-ACP methyl ester carboxylesterase
MPNMTMSATHSRATTMIRIKVAFMAEPSDLNSATGSYRVGAANGTGTRVGSQPSSGRSASSSSSPSFVSPAATEQRHTLGTSHPDRYNPDTWTDEYAHLSKPGQHEIQAALLYDYRTNVASYPAWQAWLREHKPPTLVIWGRNDPSFIAPGAGVFKRDLPDAEIHLLDAGHFALDEKNDEIARLILTFLAKHPV